MTVQAKNSLVIGKKSYRIFGGHGENLFDPKNLGWSFGSKDTAHRAGFTARYSLVKANNDEVHLCLTGVFFGDLEKLSGVDAYPILFDSVSPFVNEYGGLEYSGFEQEAPYSGLLFAERGFFKHQGLRQPTEDEDWYEEDETVGLKFDEGLLVGIQNFSAEKNRELWSLLVSGDLIDPFKLASGWPKQDKSLSARIKLGNQILDGIRTPKQVLCANPYLTDADTLFENTVVPALRLRFNESWEGATLEKMIGF